MTLKSFYRTGPRVVSSRSPGVNIISLSAIYEYIVFSPQDFDYSCTTSGVSEINFSLTLYKFLKQM